MSYLKFNIEIKVIKKTSTTIQDLYEEKTQELKNLKTSKYDRSSYR